MFILFLIVYVLLVFWLFTKKTKLICSPFIWMCLAWLLIIGLYFTSGINYTHVPSVITFLYFVTFLCVFGLGNFIGGLNATTLQNQSQKKAVVINEQIFNYCFIVQSFSFLILLLDFFINNSGMSNLHVNSSLSKVGVIAEICCLSGILGWLKGIYDTIVNNKRISIKSLLSLLFYLVPCILISGRQSLLIVLVSTIAIIGISITSKKETTSFSHSFIKTFRNWKKLKKVCFFLALILLVYTSVISSKREDVTNKILLFEYMLNAQYSTSTIDILENTGAFKSFFLEIISYYSHELPQLQMYLEKWDGTMYFGFSQFQLISSNLPTDSIFYLGNIQNKIDAIALGDGSYSHAWRTMVFNCFIDFGFIGSIVFIFFIGCICGMIYKNYFSKPSIERALLLALVCAGSFFCLQFSPFVENYWYFPLFWLLVITLYKKTQRRS